MILRDRPFFVGQRNRKTLELGLSLLVGILLGMLVVIHPYLPFPSNFQKLVLVIPFAFTLVILFNNLEKLILFAIAIGIPLNFDISLIISPYARNADNLAQGNRTLVALTELRLSLILLVVMIGYILWLVDRSKGDRNRIRFFASTSIPALGMIVISIFSLMQAEDIQLSFFKIVQLLELFLMYFYIANHIQTKQELQFFVVVLMGAMLAESLLMIVQWRTGLRFYFAGISADMYLRPNRPGGTIGQPDAAGGIIASLLVIVSAMILLFPRRTQKIFGIVCFVIGFIALISTSSRAAWGSFAVVVFGFLFIGLRRSWVSHKSLVLLSLIALAIGAIFYPVIYSRLTEDDNGSAASRPQMFRLAWNVIQDSPRHLFFGVGANNYALVASSYNTAEVGRLGYVIDSSVHNVFLLAWAETGLFGLFIYIGFLAAPLVKVRKHVQSGDRFISLMALGLGCALVAMSIQMLASPFVGRPISFYVWLLVALIASMDNLESRQVGSLVKRQVQRT